MPPKKFLNLGKLKSDTKNSGPRDGNGDRKQITISKFFSAKTLSVESQQIGDTTVIVIDDSQTKNEKPVQKRAREPEAGGDVSQPAKKTCVENGGDGKKTAASLSSLSVKKTTSSPSVALSTKTKAALQTFAACESREQGIQDFDFSALKRDKAALLPDSSDLSQISAGDVNIGRTEKSEEEEHGTGTQDVECDEASTSEGKCKVSEKLSVFSAESRSRAEKYTDKQKSFPKALLKTGPVKYTQLEQQFVELKEKYPDAVLFVECGYKYRFFGEDAEIAAQVLRIYCHQDHNFMTASIPVHRLFVHVRRLVAAGYKVGVVKQTETAALKAAGSNRNTPFSRQLTALYTKSTLIGQDVDPISGNTVEDSVGTMATNSYLMCVCDGMSGKSSKSLVIGVVAVQPATGDVLYDSFEDTSTRRELETRISHIQPVEVLLSRDVTEQTEKIIKGIQTASTRSDDCMRVEKLDECLFHYNKAFQAVSDFYQSSSAQQGTDQLQEVINLPRPVICCLAALISYLSAFHLDRVLRQVINFSKFSTKSKYMQLDGNTIRNLELFHNETDGKTRGSLYWALNQTQTKPGSRLLRSWIAQPLLSKSEIVERQEAITEVIDGHFPGFEKLKNVLSKMPDLERGLCSIFHKKCSPVEFYTVCSCLETLYKEAGFQKEVSAGQVTSRLLQQILEDIPTNLEDIKLFSQAIHEKAARDNDKTHLFVDESQFPAVLARKEAIEGVLQELQNYRRQVRLLLKQPSLQYTTVLGTEFLVEVKNTMTSIVPSDWIKISSTKAVSRYHSPYIVARYKQLTQLREQLALDCNEAWMSFLDLFGEKYQCFRQAVQQLSTLDCLFSLATVAQHHGYCRPDLRQDEMCIEVNQGRHPVLQQLLGNQHQYVPNDTRLQANTKRVMIITGPNMGGKSLYIKQTAILVIMAQIGSFVPAQSATLGIFDAVYTRMGASDAIFKGRSTFMVELQEASDIISMATPRSLVIMDELGRGTSTHDGVAIACATLDFFVKQPKCLTMFVTHYPMLAEFENAYPDVVGNYHMSFLLHDPDTAMEADDDESTDDITFLYQLVPGMAHRSYGLNVAKLANIPSDIVTVATKKSQELETKVLANRDKIAMFRNICRAEESLESVWKLLHSGEEDS